MTKFKIIISSIIVALLIASISINVVLFRNNLNNSKQIKISNNTFIELSKAFTELSKTKTYSISLSPVITTKNAATFGKVDNVQLQYYFTLDGQILGLQPDSTVLITKKKVENKR